jgi:hypothetical protein
MSSIKKKLVCTCIKYTRRWCQIFWIQQLCCPTIVKLFNSQRGKIRPFHADKQRAKTKSKNSAVHHLKSEDVTACKTKHHAMKTYGNALRTVPRILNLDNRWGEWWNSRSGWVIHDERAPCTRQVGPVPGVDPSKGKNLVALREIGQVFNGFTASKRV